MKDLKQYIEESLLNDFDTLANNIDARGEVLQFIKDTYNTPSKFRVSAKPQANGKYLVNVTGNVSFKKSWNTEYLTNGLFEFGRVTGSVLLGVNTKSGRGSLKSLEGAPREIVGEFNISGQALTSLENCPQTIRGIIRINDLNITSLKGISNYIISLECCKTNIENLEGLPNQIFGSFTCTDNPKLVSLKGISKKIYGRFILANNGKYFDVDTVKQYTDVNTCRVQVPLKESLLDDFDTLVNNINPRDEIIRFLKTNYLNPISKFVISKKLNEKGLYEVKCNESMIKVSKGFTRVTNGMFEFVNRSQKKIKFYCGWGSNLESLEGLPKEIEYLQIMHAPMSSLKDIKGWPEIIDELVLFNCPNLVSLEGGPKYVKALMSDACGKLFTKDEANKYMETQTLIQNMY